MLDTSRDTTRRAFDASGRVSVPRGWYWIGALAVSLLIWFVAAWFVIDLF